MVLATRTYRKSCPIPILGDGTRCQLPGLLTTTYDLDEGVTWISFSSLDLLLLQAELNCQAKVWMPLWQEKACQNERLMLKMFCTPEH